MKQHDFVRLLHCAAMRLASLVAAQHPCTPRTDAGAWPNTPGAPFAESATAADVDRLVASLEPDGKGMPVLLRQYLKLGGKLLGFHVDRKFSDALDGLIVVDLDQTPPKLLERYLGKQEAKEFLSWNTAGRL